MIASRPERDISATFGDQIEIELEDSVVNADIKVCIDWRLEHDDKLKGIKPQLKQEIKDELLSKASGYTSPICSRLIFVKILMGSMSP
jgi:hypothetical protein